MNKLVHYPLLIIVGFFSSIALAGNDIETLPIVEAFKLDEAKELGDSVHFYFGEKPSNITGSNTTTFKVTRKVARSKPNSCHRAFLQAMTAFKETALSKWSNSVVNITSNFDDKPIASKETYQCSKSLLSAEVNLKGEIIWGDAATAVETPPMKSSPEDRLKILKALLESGEIDQQTYDAKKAQIIESL